MAGLLRSFVWLCWVLVAARGIMFPTRGWNPGPLHGEHGILASGPPGTSRGFSIVTILCPGNAHADTVFSYPHSHL